MPYISSLKEKFATTAIEDRGSVVLNLATASTEDANYYKGLIILQKIYNEVMKQEDPSKVREGTPTEISLLNEMENHLSKILIHNERYTELYTRFNLLIYPFETSKSIEFIKKELYLDLLTQKQEQQQQVESEDKSTINATSMLDNDLIDGTNLLKKSIESVKAGGDIDLEVFAFPELKDLLFTQNSMTPEQEISLLEKLFMYPTENLFGNDILDSLIKLWKLQNSNGRSENSGGSKLENLPFHNFTITQLNYLIENIPEIVLLHKNVVKAYLEKLVPTQYYSCYSSGETITFWDDDENILCDYLSRLEEFGQKLPPIYFKFLSAIKFYQLRVDIIRENFKETKLLQFLTGPSDTFINGSPIPSRVQGAFSFNQTFEADINDVSQVSIDIPLLGNSEISEQDKFLVIKEYLTGLITHDKLTLSIETLGAYIDYYNVLKPLYAKLMLTLSPTIQESFVNTLGSEQYESLVTESFIGFSPSTLNASVKRKPDDSIDLSLRTKNIQSLSIRVFQINMENYSRLHLNDNEKTISDRNNSIDLDGLCPAWEKDIDFSSEPTIRVKTSNFKFGDKGIAPNVFKGRGLWVVEFVGGQNQCRAIVQKGYLKHIIQESTAGHIVKILDECGKPVSNSKIWCDNKYYQADEFDNILLPYLSTDGEPRTNKILLISTLDEFCETTTFFQSAEKYQLEADFYVNPEMVSFNKKATVIVTPRLKMNGIPVPLSLLERTSLHIECSNIDDVKNSSTYQNEDLNTDSIYFEFIVPDRLTTLNFSLQTKVKSLNGSLQDINVKHSVHYTIPVDNNAVPASVHLRKTSDDMYFIHAFGKNGEPKKDYQVSLKLKHAFIQNRQVNVVLKTNNEGSIDLGKLKDIQWIEYSNNQGAYKQWLINEEKECILPPAICVSAEKSFKVPCYASSSDSLFSLYKIGVRDMLIENMSTFIHKNDAHIEVSGLSEGEYMLYVTLNNKGVKTIKCTVIEGEVNSIQSSNEESKPQDRFWLNWVISNNGYSAKQNGVILHKPLEISDVNLCHDKEKLTIQLKNWSTKAFIVITTSTFVPDSSESLKALMYNRSLTRPLAQNNKSSSPQSLFLNDKKLGEEYQYVLNRARAEKWVGSNLNKPTLLMYPKKIATTTSESRHLKNKVEPECNFGHSNLLKKRGLGYNFCGRPSPCSTRVESSLSFLNHNSPIIVLSIPDDGLITIDRKTLGFGGDLLQMVAISGEQVVYKDTVLPSLRSKDSPLFHYNDLRQKINSNKAFIRSKVTKNLLPGEKLTIDTNEYEAIDSFEKLYDTIKNISHGKLDQEFEYLKTWPGLTVEKKLELHEEKVCHEFNLWLKRKDIIFFDEFVKPAIKNKVQKSFMDIYLIDGDLSYFANDIYKFRKLSTVEKTLLATTQSAEFLQTVTRSFKETFDDTKLENNSDAIFDSILSCSTLNSIENDNNVNLRSYSAVTFAGSSLEKSAVSAESYMPTSPGYSPASPGYSPTSLGYSALSPMYPSMQQSTSTTFGSRAQLLDSLRSRGDENFDMINIPVEDEADKEFQEAVGELRKKAKQKQDKVVYEFTKQTSEWVETGYLMDQNDIAVKKFWIDYLEYHSTNRNQRNFLSENFVYALSNLGEIFYILSLIDLPFASETNWTKEANTMDTDEIESNVIQLTISASPTQPLMVFYRTLNECTSSFSSNSDNNLMLGQELFLFDNNTPINSEECIKINPLSTTLETFVEYGSHVIISNISGKILSCQVTTQVPTGSVPCRTTPYCKSKTISIEPYSTWHEVTGTFYFPSAGEFSIVPVTVSSLSGDKLLGKIEAIDIKVIGESCSSNEISNDNANQSLSLSSWTTLANTGSDAKVIAFLESYKKLDRLDLSLIEWRMKDQSFARKVFNVLSQQRYFFSRDLWKYGVYHQFDDIIRDLLNFDSGSLLANVGQTFESPLVCKKRQDSTQIFDYYPLLNARAHPLKSTSHEILNAQFYNQYDNFLTYLSQQTSRPSNTDLVILTLYLILQDRIGDAQSTFNRIESVDDNSIDCQVQFDYIKAYLKTRIPVINQTEQHIQDLESVKEITVKYKDFGVLKWRKLFAELHDFVCEVEQGDYDISGGLSQQSTKRIQSEPILEFEINQQLQELVLQHANIKSVDIKYYEMNIEVMFSTNPFINDNTASVLKNENFTWIKPNLTSRIELPEKQQVNVTSDADNDYNMIGVGQINSVQTSNIPFSGENKNLFIEISSVGTQNIIKRRQSYFSNNLYTHFAESFGIVRVLSGRTKRPLAGAYVKVYARMNNQKVHFWKDGYTGLNGVFDYISVTEGNALMGEETIDLKTLMNEKIDKLSILILSTDEGAVVKEAYPPLT